MSYLVFEDVEPKQVSSVSEYMQYWENVLHSFMINNQIIKALFEEAKRNIKDEPRLDKSSEEIKKIADVLKTQLDNEAIFNK